MIESLAHSTAFRLKLRGSILPLIPLHNTGRASADVLGKLFLDKNLNPVYSGEYQFMPCPTGSFLICPRAFHETIRTQIIQDMSIDLPSRYKDIENLTLNNEMRLSTLACIFHCRSY